MYKYRHRIDSGRHMLDGDTILLESLQRFTAEANLSVHHIFVDADSNKSLLTCDTCNCIFRLLACTLHDQCSVRFRIICIADIDWNTGLTYREYRIFM